MAFNSATERDLALKKIVGKAHTSPAKEIANESLTSGLTISSQTVFGQPIPDAPNNSDFYKKPHYEDSRCCGLDLMPERVE